MPTSETGNKGSGYTEGFGSFSKISVSGMTIATSSGVTQEHDQREKIPVCVVDVSVRIFIQCNVHVIIFLILVGSKEALSKSP